MDKRSPMGEKERRFLIGLEVHEEGESKKPVIHGYAARFEEWSEYFGFGAWKWREKIRAGAALLQVYTGFIYEGPTLPRRICAELAQLLVRDGFAHLRDAVGVDAPA